MGNSFTDDDVSLGLQIATERGDIMSWGWAMNGTTKRSIYIVHVPGLTYEFNLGEAHAFLVGLSRARKALFH